MQRLGKYTLSIKNKVIDHHLMNHYYRIAT